MFRCGAGPNNTHLQSSLSPGIIFTCTNLCCDEEHLYVRVSLKSWLANMLVNPSVSQRIRWGCSLSCEMRREGVRTWGREDPRRYSVQLLQRIYHRRIRHFIFGWKLDQENFCSLKEGTFSLLRFWSNQCVSSWPLNEIPAAKSGSKCQNIMWPEGMGEVGLKKSYRSLKDCSIGKLLAP